MRRQLKSGKLPTAGAGLAATHDPEPATQAAPAAASATAAPATPAAAAAQAPRRFGFGRPATTAAQGGPTPVVAQALSSTGTSEEHSGPGSEGDAAQASASAPEGGSSQPLEGSEAQAAGSVQEQQVRAESTAGAARGAADTGADSGRSFSTVVRNAGEQKRAVASIATVKVLARLAEGVAHRPGMMAEERELIDALRNLYRQTLDMGGAIARGCKRGEPPDWLKTQAMQAAANLICSGWESGMSGEEIRVFNARLGDLIINVAKDADLITEEVGFDGYIMADTKETAQARLYVSVTSAIARLVQVGVEPSRAGDAIREVVAKLEAHETHVEMKLDMRTAWMQGSVGRVTDFMIAWLQSPALVLGGDDRLTDSVNRAIGLFQQVEQNAKKVLDALNGPRAQDAPADRTDDRAPGPVAG